MLDSSPKWLCARSQHERRKYCIGARETTPPPPREGRTHSARLLSVARPTLSLSRPPPRCRSSSPSSPSYSLLRDVSVTSVLPACLHAFMRTAPWSRLTSSLVAFRPSDARVVASASSGTLNPFLSVPFISGVIQWRANSARVLSS